MPVRRWPFGFHALQTADPRWENHGKTEKSPEASQRPPRASAKLLAGASVYLDDTVCSREWKYYQEQMEQ